MQGEWNCDLLGEQILPEPEQVLYHAKTENRLEKLRPRIRICQRNTTILLRVPPNSDVDFLLLKN